MVSRLCHLVQHVSLTPTWMYNHASHISHRSNIFEWSHLIMPTQQLLLFFASIRLVSWNKLELHYLCDSRYFSCRSTCKFGSNFQVEISSSFFLSSSIHNYHTVNKPSISKCSIHSSMKWGNARLDWATSKGSDISLMIGSFNPSHCSIEPHCILWYQSWAFTITRLEPFRSSFSPRFTFCRSWSSTDQSIYFAILPNNGNRWRQIQWTHSIILSIRNVMLRLYWFCMFFRYGKKCSTVRTSSAT